MVVLYPIVLVAALYLMFKSRQRGLGVPGRLWFSAWAFAGVLSMFGLVTGRSIALVLFAAAAYRDLLALRQCSLLARGCGLSGRCGARCHRSRPVRLTPSARAATVIEHMFAEGGPMLTERQRQILDFVTKYVDAHGYPPTVREIGEAVGLASPSTVHAHLANLERAGLIKRDPTKPRALELRREPKAVAADVHKLPLVGEVAAGGPLLAEENVEEYLAVPEPLSKGGEEFLLRVKGDSMIDAGILDGDIAVIERRQDARNGDIVVALAGDDESADEATLKRFFREDGRVRLQPENAALEPIYAQHVQILGKVIGVFRQL